jgi:hypothetical protein
MTDWKLPWQGGCRCGALRFAITAPPIMAGACHCTGCQRMTGGAYSLALSFEETAFAVTRGEPVLGGLKGPVRHYHCSSCLSWVFTRADDPAWLVNLRPTMLDDAAWFAPFIEFYAAEKLPFAATGATHSYATFPDPTEWPQLMAEYAETGARP